LKLVERNRLFSISF